ncbi:MAG: hypothetical protein QNK05_03930 [Myxococcota bacterium]|nr:hypothetical protein [Myxococcota bacterium]
MRLLLLVVLAPFSLVACSTVPEPMTRERLEGEIAELTSSFTGAPGRRSFVFDEVEMACVSDVAADRMRLVAPIASVGEIEAEQVAIMLEANFHTALDARYATSRGVLYAAFIHPLSSLSVEQIRSALVQTANLARTFGTTYSSGVLAFGGADGGGTPEESGDDLSL